MSPRDTYHALRRSYRATCRLSLLAPGAIEARMAARDALRKFTGCWDDFRPAYTYTQQGATLRRTAAGNSIYHLPVWAACTRWLRATKGV